MSIIFSACHALKAISRFKWISISLMFLLTVATSLASAAQGNDGFPKKTGVVEPGVQHDMSELKPDAEFPVSGHPDWRLPSEASGFQAAAPTILRAPMPELEPFRPQLPPARQIRKAASQLVREAYGW